MSRPYLVDITQLRAAHHTPAWWAKARLLPLVHTWRALNQFQPTDPLLIPELVTELAALCPAGFLISWPCYEPHFPGILNPWEPLLASTAALGAALRAHHGGGLVLDCEDYRASGGGGKMKKGTWAPGTAAKGTALAKALGSGLSLGCMVWAGEFPAQPGLRNFWRAAFKQNHHGQVLGEDYAGSGGVAAAKALGGRYLIGGGPKSRGADWVWDPSGVLLKG